jgi:hypothetical protein
MKINFMLNTNPVDFGAKPINPELYSNPYHFVKKQLNTPTFQYTFVAIVVLVAMVCCFCVGCHCTKTPNYLNRATNVQIPLTIQPNQPEA